MCLLCEELWMPFELPPEAKPRAFVADSPEPEDGGQTTEDGKPNQPLGNPSSVLRRLTAEAAMVEATIDVARRPRPKR
jgi:hypothetical protein